MNVTSLLTGGRRSSAIRSDGSVSDRRLGHRAVVLGGSLAGLLSGSVLAGHFDQVVIIERDDLAGHLGGPRRGAPQSRHSHGLLVGGSRAFERLLPGFTKDLIARGAVQTDVIGRARWVIGGVEQARFDSDLDAIMASRPLIEDEMRRRVLGLPNVVALGGHDVVGLVVSDDKRRVLGARTASNASSGTAEATAEDLVDNGTVLADLVVDATGRGSRAATWLTELGYSAVKEDVVENGLTYATHLFRQRPGVLDDLDFEVVGSDPEGSRSGAALRQENGLWTVTLIGAFGERPPTELAGFEAFARGLRTSGLAEIIAGCEPVGELRTFRYPSSRWLHWEKMAELPERFMVIGDAACSFNPAYGQGMSSAAQQAVALADVLEGGLPGLSVRSAKAIAGVIATPWALATGTDRRHVSQPAKPLPERLVDRYLDRFVAVAAHDRKAAMAFSRVLNLLAAPTSLLSPRLAARVLRPGSRRREA